MRVFFVIFILLSSIQSFFAGCGAIRCSTNTGILIQHGEFGNVEKVNITASDSMYLNVQSIGDCPLSSFILIFNNDTIYTYAGYGGITIKIPQKAGKYNLFAKNSMAVPWNYTFELVENMVGISESSPHLETLKVYPNPVVNRLKLSNKDEGIKTLSIYNSLNQKTEDVEVNASDIEIPLNNYPSGVYYIRLSTFNSNTISRKIIIIRD